MNNILYTSKNALESYGFNYFCPSLFPSQAETVTPRFCSCPLQNVAYIHFPVPIFFFLIQSSSNIVATKVVYLSVSKVQVRLKAEIRYGLSRCKQIVHI